MFPLHFSVVSKCSPTKRLWACGGGGGRAVVGWPGSATSHRGGAPDELSRRSHRRGLGALRRTCSCFRRSGADTSGPCRPVQGCLPGRAGPGDSRRPREHARHCEPSGAEPAPRPSGPAPPGQCSPAPKRPGPRAGQPEATPQPQSLELPSPGAPLRPPPPRPLLQNHGGGRGCFPPTAPPPPAACPGSPKPCVGGCAPASGDV